jgi:hypothetical protein
MPFDVPRNRPRSGSIDSERTSAGGFVAVELQVKPPSCEMRNTEPKRAVIP